MDRTDCSALEAGPESGRQLVLWELGRQEVTIDFTGQAVVSDAGLLALRQLDRQLGVLAEAASRLADPRSQRHVSHDAEQLLIQQVYQLLAGYFDANDANALRRDPLFQTIADLPPSPEQPGASGSTISRFRYAYTRRERNLPIDERTIDEERQAAECQRLRALNQFYVELFVKTRPQPPTRIILDIDASDDPTHGGQQLSLFHGYYDQHQLFPLFVFDGESGFPLAAWLRSGTAHPSWGAVETLAEIVAQLRIAWPDVEIVVRADAGYATPELLSFLEEQRLKYVIGYARNAVLERRSQLWQNYIAAWSDLHEEPAFLFTEFSDYQSQSWEHPRRVIAKCEVTATGGPNRRFVVTNLTDTPREIYHGLYVKRGKYPEHGIQELKHGLQMDRLSAHRFFANAFTLQCHVLAYALWVLFREANADVPEVADHQLATVRLRLFKVGAVVTVSMRRIWFRISETWPGSRLLQQASAAVSAFAARFGRLWPDRLEEGLSAKLGGDVLLLK